MSEILTETTEETFEFPEIIEPVNQYYVALNEENRITMVTSTKQNNDMFLFDFPVGFDISQHINYKIIDGELVFDEFIYPEIEVQPTLEQQFEDYKVEQTEINAELMYEMSLWQLGMM